MIEAVKFVNELSGVRLDAALFFRYPSSTKAFIRDALRTGEIKVNGRTEHIKGRKLIGGETIYINHLAEAADNTVTPETDLGRLPTNCLEPIYADDDLLAYDKPAGMSVHPLSRTETGTLMNAVVALHPECRFLGDRPLMAGALHRIDSGTSGLVMVARNHLAFERLRAQFAAQTIEKTYLALVEGEVSESGVLEHYLVHDPAPNYCKMVSAEGRYRHLRERAFHAITNFRPLGVTRIENELRTLLEVKIFTGVTHQIRAQLALGGMHIINDRLYGAFAIEYQLGHCLHAYAAKFRHPSSDVEMEIKTSLPAWALI